LISSYIGEPIGRADAAFVRECTGYAIGGIPPLGHARRLNALIDQELLRFDVVYAAGGTPHAMFPLLPSELVRVVDGRVADVALLAS
jgi:prolyl-tRNA editing enzyme YbaK/EbsC (Cys-tRNA(Pro) deacylase)